MTDGSITNGRCASGRVRHADDWCASGRRGPAIAIAGPCVVARSRAVTGVIAVLAAVLLIGCTQKPCEPRPDDPNGYLLKVCQHVREKKIDVSPGSATTYTIKRIEERTDNGRAVVWVFLSCCYLGDIAVFDKETGELISFRVGAK